MKKYFLPLLLFGAVFLVSFTPASADSDHTSEQSYQYRSYKYHRRVTTDPETKVRTLEEIQEEARDRLRSDKKYKKKIRRRNIQYVKPNIKRSKSYLEWRRAKGSAVSRSRRALKKQESESKKGLRPYFRDTGSKRNFHRVVNRQDRSSDFRRRTRQQSVLSLRRNRKKDLRLGDEGVE